MNAEPLQSTLREMQRLAREPRSWAVLAGLSVVVGLVGPFGTFAMPMAARLAYWAVVVVTTGAVGTFAAGLGERLLLPRLPGWLAMGLAGAAAGIPVALTVAGFNLLAYGRNFEAIDLGTLIAYCAPICAAVTLLAGVMAPPADTQDTGAEQEATAPAIVERLPLPQRGRLIHIAVADHYVEVTTDRGRALLLMRLSDAIREAQPTPGLQVHRSHWVALAAVRRATRRNGKPVLELETGAEVPVSRSYLPAVREAGLIN